MLQVGYFNAWPDALATTYDALEQVSGIDCSANANTSISNMCHDSIQQLVPASPACVSALCHGTCEKYNSTATFVHAMSFQGSPSSLGAARALTPPDVGQTLQRLGSSWEGRRKLQQMCASHDHCILMHS